MVPLKPRKGGQLVISSYKEVPRKEGRKKSNKEKIMLCWLGWQAGGLTQRFFSFLTLLLLQPVYRRDLNVKTSAKKAGNLAMVNADGSIDQTTSRLNGNHAMVNADKSMDQTTSR
jgi:hypothetical protein